MLSTRRFLTPKYESLFPHREATCSSRLPVCLAISQVFSRLCSSFCGPDSWIFFVISDNRQKRKREPPLWPPDLWPPQLPVLPLLLGLRAPQWGKSVCSGQGFGLSRRLEDSFPVQTGFPPPIDLFLALSLSCSFNRSFSLGPDSDQRLLEERADIYCSGAEGQEYGGPTLSKSKLNKEINDSKNNIKNKRTEKITYSIKRVYKEILKQLATIMFFLFPESFYLFCPLVLLLLLYTDIFLYGCLAANILWSSTPTKKCRY